MVREFSRKLARTCFANSSTGTHCSGHPDTRRHIGHLNSKLDSSFPIASLDMKCCRHSSQKLCEQGRHLGLTVCCKQIIQLRTTCLLTVFFRSRSWVLSKKKVYFCFALNALAVREGRWRSLQSSKSISFGYTVKSLNCEEFILYIFYE